MFVASWRDGRGGVGAFRFLEFCADEPLVASGSDVEDDERLASSFKMERKKSLKASGVKREASYFGAARMFGSLFN